MNLIEERVSAARAGSNSTVICRMPSGWAVLADMQYLRGYTILLADPVVPGLNDLDPEGRLAYLSDMAVVGDALLEVTGAFRINYAILCNTEPALHTHIVPRYLDEPEEFRKGPPWAYARAHLEATPFNLERDKDLMQQIARAIQKRL